MNITTPEDVEAVKALMKIAGNYSTIRKLEDENK